jgi:hypothetical protein
VLLLLLPPWLLPVMLLSLTLVGLGGTAAAATAASAFAAAWQLTAPLRLNSKRCSETTASSPAFSLPSLNFTARTQEQL